MSNDLALAIKLTTEGGQVVVKDLTAISGSAKSAGTELTGAGTAGENAGRGFNTASAGADSLDKHLRTLYQSAGLIVGGLGAMRLIDRADEWGQMASRIRQATRDADEYEYVQRRMVSSANDTYRSLEETRESFVQMSPILRDMNYTLSQSIDINDSFSALLVTNAASAERASSAQRALSGSIQQGRVTAQAWQTIFGVMPSVLDNLTAATGRSGAEIRELGVTGQLALTDLTNALLLSNETNLAAVESMPTTVRDSFQQFQNVFEDYIGRVNESRGATVAMAAGVEFLAEHMETLVAIAGGAAVAALTNYTARKVVSTRATIADMMAKRAATAQELQLSQAQVAQTQVSLNQARALAQLGGGHVRVAAATAAHEAAVIRLTAAQRAHTTVARGLLGFMTGPAGLALTAGVAATSLIAFGDASETARDRAERLKDEVRELTGEYENLSKVRAAVQLDTAEENLRLEKETTEELQRQRDVLAWRLSLAGAWDAQSEKALENQRTGIAAIETELRKVIGAQEINSDNIQQFEQQVKSLQAVLNGEPITPPSLPTQDNKELTNALLELYNAQMLNAHAIDETGRALNSIDFDLFRAEFEAVTELPEDAAAAIREFAAEAQRAQANLSLDNHLEQLREQISLMDVLLTQGEAEYEIQQALAQFSGADSERLAALREELAVMQQKQALADDQDTLATLQRETELLRIRLVQGREEYEIQKALYELKGGDPAVLASIEAELRLQQQLNEQIRISEDIAGDAWGNMLDDMTALSSAGQQFGDVMTEAFGRVAQQLGAMSAAQVHYNRTLDDLRRKREDVEKLEKDSPDRAQTLLDIQRTEARLQRENFQAQMGQYSALTGAAGNMFSEQSKGREALHRMELVFSAIEITMAMQRAGANALAAITNQGNGDPYTAFARIAAMGAIMAGLGVFSGSVSGSANLSADRQAEQGTGTVLGDDGAKSESIVNALERIADLSLDQYHELRSMNSNLRALNAGIANLAVSLVGNFGSFNADSYQGDLGTTRHIQMNGGLAAFAAGGVVGLGIDKLMGGVVGDVFNSILGGISRTTRNLVDSGLSIEAQALGDIIATGLLDASYYNVIETTKRRLWGASKRSSTHTEYDALDNELSAEFARIFSHIGSSITDAVQYLGIGAGSLDGFVIDLPHISFKDLTGDEIQAELEAVFSQQADLMTRYLVPAMGDYQKMGEGLFDTLIRVAQEQAIFNASLNALGLELGRFGDITADVQVEIAQTLIELMGGIEAFRDLTSQYFNSFYSEAEQFEHLSDQLNQAFAGLGLSIPNSREQFRDMIDALDLTTEAGQALFAQLMQLVPGLDEYFNSLDAQTDEFEREMERLADALERQLSAINGLLNNIGNDILSLQRTLPGFDNVAYLTQQVDELYASLTGSDTLDEQLELTGELRSALMERYNAELQALSEAGRAADELHRAALDAHRDELAAVQALNRAAENLQATAAQMLLGDLSPLTTGQRLAEAQSQFDVALAAARGGDADAYALVQSLGQQILQLSRDYNPAAYTDIFGDIKDIFDELGATLYDEPDAPPLHPDVVAYEDAKIALAEQTISELQRLQEQTALLRDIARDDYELRVQEIPVVNGAVVVDNKDVVEQIRKLQQEQSDAAEAARREQADHAAHQRRDFESVVDMQHRTTRAVHDLNDTMQRMVRMM